MSDSTGRRLGGRVALVTGAGNGVGRACAEALASHGAAVLVNDLGTDEYAHGSSSRHADDTVASIRARGGAAEANYDSVADADGCTRAVQAANDAFGNLDIVVACAGAILDGGLDADDDTYERFVALFMSQKFWLARAAVPAMRERGWGRLIMTTSHGATGLLGQPIFAATMGGVVSMVKAIAHECRDSGVTANCLAPGSATRLHAVVRPMFEDLRAKQLISEDEWQSYLNTPPPEYVAPVVAWLCTDRVGDVSGQVIHAVGNTIGRWTAYEQDRAIYRGDPASTPPWTLDELDELVPSVLLAGTS